MTARARRLAEACFAVARSTTHAGERAAAIGRGEAICAKHALLLDDFDIPGRQGRLTPNASRRPAPFPHRSSEDFERQAERMRKMAAEWERHQRNHARATKAATDALSKAAQGVAEAFRQAGAKAHETLYQARQRNFEEACRSAAERDRVHDCRAAAKNAADELWKRELYVYGQGIDLWLVIGGGASRTMTDAELLDLVGKLRGEAVA